MRSALLCVFFALIVLPEEIYTQDNGFRPTPIPLNEWHHEKREGRAGTLHETFKTELPPSVAAIPAHYWEDALRHSVYLTLVRDKIDELIAKGDVISPNSNPGGYDSKEIDDHDLWDKIKTAPFDRIQDEDPGSYGDVTIMAKGRLMEDESGFRFTEDERTKEKCSNDNCTQGVKAFWSVKRVRQRDQEISPGKYHYELTFSVISQIPKKQRKPYENPIRTFTVKEGSPPGVKDRPQEFRKFRQNLSQVARPQRAIWFHKNIAPAKQTGRKYFQGLDRIFSSFFSEDEDRSFDSPAHKFSTFTTQIPLYSKNGHASVQNDQHFQIPFPYRPFSLKHVRPPLQATPINPIQHPHLDMSLIATSTSNSHAPFSFDHRVESNQPVKTTRPAVLPTPVPQTLPYYSHSGEVTNMMSFGSTDNTSPNPDSSLRIHNNNNKYKAAPVKVNYFTEHVRPPIYSAPPGVFVTMDKKPFKPMPPIKLMHSSKPYRTNKPIDFRPSPQIMDVLNTDSLVDNAFRPITINLDKTTEKLSDTETTKKIENKMRKTTASGKKPLKKHDNTKLQRTTLAPDIITAQSTSEEKFESMEWANILGAFTKTTPMFPQTEKIQTLESTTPMTTTITPKTTQKTTTTTEALRQSTISSTAKPKKRTRPPPKFVKQDKIKKHKRFTTSTTSTTIAPESNFGKGLKHDLMPQATSAATGITKSTKFYKDSKNTTQTSLAISTTTSTTTNKSTTTTTAAAVTTTTQLPNVIPTKKTITSTTQSRSKNRFRQSTLMLKGTSVKHDRWNGIQKNQTTTPYSTHPTYRRKGSNFHGYITSTTPRLYEEKRKENHPDRKPSSSTESNSMKTTEFNAITNPSYAETIDEYETNSVLPSEQDEFNDKQGEQDYEDESKDHSEFIFQPTATTVLTLSTTPAPSTNKTKCKKKKPVSTTDKSINSDTLAITTMSYTTVTTAKAPAEKSTTNSIFEEFLNFNFNDDEDDENDDIHSRADLKKEGSMNQESYLKLDDFEDLLDIHLTNAEKEHTEVILDDDHYSNGDDDTQDDNDEDDDEYQSSKMSSQEDDTELHLYDENGKEDLSTQSNSAGVKEKRPFTLLELMAMS